MFRVVCIDNHAFLALDEEGRPRQPGPDERLASSLTIDKVYEVLAVEHGMYRIVDDTGEDYLFPKAMFRRVRR
jgi:hypothetical protein